MPYTLWNAGRPLVFEKRMVSTKLLDDVNQCSQILEVLRCHNLFVYLLTIRRVLTLVLIDDHKLSLSVWIGDTWWYWKLALTYNCPNFRPWTFPRKSLVVASRSSPRRKCALRARESELLKLLCWPCKIRHKLIGVIEKCWLRLRMLARYVLTDDIRLAIK